MLFLLNVIEYFFLVSYFTVKKRHILVARTIEMCQKVFWTSAVNHHLHQVHQNMILPTLEKYIF